MNPTAFSVVIPAYNEEEGIGPTLERLKKVAAGHGLDLECIVVDDASTDRTGEVARAAGARVIRNPENGGYGLSLQRGIRAATNELVAITDADGTYPVEELPRFVAMMDEGLDMTVGARQGPEYAKGRLKNPARVMFRIIAEFVAGRKIPDINSGLRVFRRSKLLPYLRKTCLGFSFTTSVTLIFLLNGHFVRYLPIAYDKRSGTSKVRHFRDTLRTAQIMISIIAAYNPVKLAIMIDMVAVIAATIALFVAWVAPWAVVSATSIIAGGGLLAALPVIFMLGCIGELMRMHRSNDEHAA